MIAFPEFDEFFKNLFNHVAISLTPGCNTGRMNLTLLFC